MSRKNYRFRHAASWLFCSWVVCALAFGLAPLSFGQQALPPLIPVNVPNFTIPFEIGGTSNSVREVELLVSKDRGRRWLAVARQPVESGKFAFRADSDGEYWFTFRTVTATGDVTPSNGQPLRVQVKTNESAIVLPSQPSDSGPLTPPKPQRFRTGDEPKLPPQSKQTVQPASNTTDEAESSESTTESVRTDPLRTDAERPARILAPKLPGFEIPEPGRYREQNVLDDLLSGMSPFMDVQPALSRSTPPLESIASKSNVAPAVPGPSQSSVQPPRQSPVDLPAGGIAGITLNPTEKGSQIVVRWNPGQGLWRDAQIDVLRSGAPEGPWAPIAINLPNSGEYWWFITPEDLKPFYVAVRIRSVEGGIQQDVTKSVITIDPRLSQFQRPRP